MCFACAKDRRSVAIEVSQLTAQLGEGESRLGFVSPSGDPPPLFLSLLSFH